MILRSVGYGTISTWLVKTHSRMHDEAFTMGVFWYCDYYDWQQCVRNMTSE